jgi:hypothetical protein
MLTLNQKRTTQSELKIGAPIQHRAIRTRIKSRRRLGVETREEFRRDVGGALVSLGGGRPDAIW